MGARLIINREFSNEQRMIEAAHRRLMNGSREERMNFWVSTGIYTKDGNLRAAYK